MLRGLRLLDDSISELMRSRIMGGALDLHGEVLQQIFAHFSGVDATDKKAKMAAGMMNVMECHELCEASGLYTIGENEFTIREMLVCFVKVNLDDDLFYQESYTYYGYTYYGYTYDGYTYYGYTYYGYTFYIGAPRRSHASRLYLRWLYLLWLYFIHRCAAPLSCFQAILTMAILTMAILYT